MGLRHLVQAVPSKLTRYGLSQIINHLLGLGAPGRECFPTLVIFYFWELPHVFKRPAESPKPFDFLVNGELVRQSLEKFLLAKSISAVGDCWCYANRTTTASSLTCMVGMNQRVMILHRKACWTLSMSLQLSRQKQSSNSRMTTGGPQSRIQFVLGQTVLSGTVQFKILCGQHRVSGVAVRADFIISGCYDGVLRCFQGECSSQALLAGGKGCKSWQRSTGAKVLIRLRASSDHYDVN